MEIKFTKNQIFTSILISAFLLTVGNLSVFAIEKNNVSINWEKLNLSKEQGKNIEMLDMKWKKINETIRPQILRDQQKLKCVLKNQNATDSEIRQIQMQILMNQNRLKYEALELFLDKRRLLTPIQRKKFHMLIPE